MKYEVFNETHQRGFNSLITPPSAVQIAYPVCMRGIMHYIKENFLGISLLRIGFDGIELATDTTKLDSVYLEYNMYADAAKYNARKQAYADYLSEQADTSESASTEHAKYYSLKNGQKAWLYANDDDRILVWCASPEKVSFFPYSETEFIALIEGTVEGETIYDPKTDMPLVQSRNLPDRAAPLTAEHGNLRFDGLYALHEKGTTRYLRFFPTGQVVGTCSAGSADDVIKWLDTEFDASGTYTVRGNTIEFTIEEDDIIIGEKFWGEIQENALLLNWKQKKTSRKVQSALFIFEST